MLLNHLASLMSREKGFIVPHTLAEVEDTEEHQLSNIERTIQSYADQGYTMRRMVYELSPPSETNNPDHYLHDICGGLQCNPDTLVSDAMNIV